MLLLGAVLVSLLGCGALHSDADGNREKQETAYIEKADERGTGANPAESSITEKTADEKREKENANTALKGAEGSREESQIMVGNRSDGELEYSEWDEKIHAAILSQNENRYMQEECCAEGHLVLEQQEKDGVMTLYLLTMYGEYQFQDGNFVKNAGTGVIPAVLTFKMNKAGDYVLHTFEEPDSGSGYLVSVQRLFPRDLWETCISPSQEQEEALKKQQEYQAMLYLKEIGREAVVGEYADFSHTLLTDVGVSVEISNRVSEYNKDVLNGYPFWLGAVEVLENDTRYEYRMTFDREKNQILFVKTDLDKNQTAERHTMDAETGELTSEVLEASAAHADVLLTDAPEMGMQDSLSAKYEPFWISSGNYQWNYKRGDELVSVVACGLSPLEEETSVDASIKLAQYQNMDAVSYQLEFLWMPDQIRMEIYDGTDLGDPDAEPIDEAVYEEHFLINFETDRIYVMNVTWEKEKLEERGFYGEAEYVVRTR